LKCAFWLWVNSSLSEDPSRASPAVVSRSFVHSANATLWPPPLPPADRAAVLPRPFRDPTIRRPNGVALRLMFAGAVVGPLVADETIAGHRAGYKSKPPREWRSLFRIWARCTGAGNRKLDDLKLPATRRDARSDTRRSPFPRSLRASSPRLTAPEPQAEA
jgi:hypothetical protein